MSRFLFMGVQEDPEFDTHEARGFRVYDGTEPKRDDRAYDGGPRDEFACPCCRVPTDSSECDDCRNAECGEQEPYAGCLRDGGR